MHETSSTPESAGPSALRTLGATLTGNAYLVVGTLVFSLLTLVAAIVPTGGRWTYRVARMWAQGLLMSSWIRLRVERPAAPSGGRVDQPPSGSFVFLVNHLSLFDIPALLAAIPEPSPLSRQAEPLPDSDLRLGDARGGVHSGRPEGSLHGARLVLDARSTGCAHGASIVIFPEETRSLDGALLPFRRGGILLAMKSGLPVVPVGIEGTFEVQMRRSFLIRPREVTMRFGEPEALAGRSVRELGTIAEELRRKVAALARAPLAGATVRNEEDRERAS